MITKHDVNVLLSEAYAQAALPDKYNMRSVADLFETIRPQLISNNVFETWNDLKLEPEKFRNDECIKVVTELKQQYFDTYYKMQFSLLADLEKENQKQSLAVWEQLYATAAVHFKDEMICMLCQIRKQWPNESKETVKKLQEFSLLIQDNRWPDCYAYYKDIADNDALTIEIRALAEVILGEIILYYYPDPASSKEHFEKAISLQPEHYITRRGWGEYCLKTGEHQKARDIFLSVLSIKPTDFSTFNFIGDSFKIEEQYESAEFWYNDALRINFLQPESYLRLINLYAESAIFKQKIQEFGPLLHKIVQLKDNASRSSFSTDECIKETTLYHTYRDLASAYFINNEYELCEEWIEFAIAYQPHLTQALVDKANIKIQLKKYKEARTCLDKALQIAPANFDIYWSLAWLYEQQNNIAMAEQAYQKCLELRPAWSGSIFNFKGNMYLKEHDFENAIHNYQLAIEHHSGFAIYQDNLLDAIESYAAAAEEKKDWEKANSLYDWLFKESNNSLQINKAGNYYFSKENYKLALQCYSKAVNLNPAEPVFHENRGLANEYAGNIKEAEKAYKKACQINNTSGSSDNRLGYFYYTHQQYRKAIIAYKKALQKEPGNKNYWQNLVRAYGDDNQLTLAEETNKILVTKFPGESTYLAQLAFYQASQEKFEEAEKNLQKAIELNPDDTYVMEIKAGLMEKKKDLERAIAVYEVVMQKEPDNDTLMNKIGELHYQGGKHEKAIDFFKKAIKKNQKNIIYLQNLAMAYAGKKDFEKAEETYLSIFKIKPDNADAWNNLGLIQYLQKQYDEAEKSYRKAIKMNEAQAVYYENLGVLYRDQQKDEEAIKTFQKAIQIDANNAAYYNELGVLHLRKGDVDSALEYFQVAIALKPDELLYQENMGYAHYSVYNYEQAKAAFKAILEKAPASAKILNYLGNIACETEVYEKAIEYYEKAISIDPSEPVYASNLNLANEKLKDMATEL